MGWMTDLTVMAPAGRRGPEITRGPGPAAVAEDGPPPPRGADAAVPLPPLPTGPASRPGLGDSGPAPLGCFDLLPPPNAATPPPPIIGPDAVPPPPPFSGGSRISSSCCHAGARFFLPEVLTPACAAAAEWGDVEASIPPDESACAALLGTFLVFAAGLLALGPPVSAACMGSAADDPDTGMAHGWVKVWSRSHMGRTCLCCWNSMPSSSVSVSLSGCAARNIVIAGEIFGNCFKHAQSSPSRYERRFANLLSPHHGRLLSTFSSCCLVVIHGLYRAQSRLWFNSRRRNFPHQNKYRDIDLDKLFLSKECDTHHTVISCSRGAGNVISISAGCLLAS